MKHCAISLVGQACTGCEACVQKCPTGALSMVQNQEGFFYPKVENNLCTECGACLNVCPFTRKGGCAVASLPKVSWAGTHKNRDILLESSSGGAFSALISTVRPDVVYGMAWQDGHSVCLTRCIPDETSVLRKSKYVQGRIKSGYQQVQSDLQSGKRVLYSGTPCQVAGLLGFLGNKANTLTTVEVICHGVSSPGLFVQYCKTLERTAGSPVDLFLFREKNKKRGDWETYHTIATYADGRKRSSFCDPFTSLFLQRTILRPCCSTCTYASPNRVSDIVIGDYWGCDTQNPALYDAAGVSVILPITEHGQTICKELGLFMTLSPVSTANIVQQNDILLAPKAANPNRAAFFRAVNEKGLSNALEQYATKPSWKQKLKPYLLPLLRRK